MKTEQRIIKSYSFSQEEILSQILRLYAPQGIDADITYSIGQFYKSGEVPPPRMKFDIEPQTDDTVAADSRHLPLGDKSLGCIVFDPPFLAATGKSLFTQEGNLTVRRFGCYASEKELFAYYRATMSEVSRVLKDDGIAIVKCQDKISSGKQFVSHHYILNMASEVGLYCEDIFILLAKTRILSPKHDHQKHARKYHSYFLVFRKSKKKVEIIRRNTDGIHPRKPVETH